MVSSDALIFGRSRPNNSFKPKPAAEVGLIQPLYRKEIYQMTDPETNTLPVWFVVIAWAALSLILNVLGVFATHPDKPPLALLTSVIGPPILFVIAYSFSAKVRTLSLSLDLRLLTAMQAWRVIGAMFLVLMSFGLLPGTFAWPAGIGDLIVGAYAPFVVLAISRPNSGLAETRCPAQCSWPTGLRRCHRRWRA